MWKTYHESRAFSETMSVSFTLGQASLQWGLRRYFAGLTRTPRVYGGDICRWVRTNQQFMVGIEQI